MVKNGWMDGIILKTRIVYLGILISVPHANVPCKALLWTSTISRLGLRRIIPLKMFSILLISVTLRPWQRDLWFWRCGELVWPTVWQNCWQVYEQRCRFRVRTCSANFPLTDDRVWNDSDWRTKITVYSGKHHFTSSFQCIDTYRCDCFTFCPFFKCPMVTSPIILGFPVILNTSSVFQ